MYSTTERRETDTEIGRKTRKYGLPAMLCAAAIAFGLGWFSGQALEKNNADNIPGGQATDGVSGTSSTDLKGGK